MTKYAFITELVKAGCDIDKLSNEAKSLIESITTEEKKLSAYDLFKDDYKDSNKVDDVSDKSFIKGELMAAIASLEAIANFGKSNLNMARKAVVDGDYRRASSYLNIYASFIDRDDTESRSNYEKASRYIGQLL
jgi:hypothetical protein